jgi:putative transposase
VCQARAARHADRWPGAQTATKPPAKNLLQQQAKFDRFIECYNQERPHRALNMKYPTEVYRVSSRPYQGLPKLDYPLHDRIVTGTSCGWLCISRRKINLSRAFAGQDVGIREVAEKIWLVTFMHYDLGFFDHETGRVECAPNPFEAQVLPMSPAPCVRVVVASPLYDQSLNVGGLRTI